jgi:hypothetical protein
MNQQDDELLSRWIDHLEALLNKTTNNNDLRQEN